MDAAVTILRPRREGVVSRRKNGADLHPLGRLDTTSWRKITIVIESYLLRRAVVGWSTKGYNRIFLSLVRAIQKVGRESVATTVSSALASLTGENAAWPSDDLFSSAWLNVSAYRTLNRGKLTHILQRLNSTYQSSKNEVLSIESDLTVEHILPQQWKENWLLSDGTPGMSWEELEDSDPSDARAIATSERERAIQTFGNLTILTQSLNSSVSNGHWHQKKPALLAASLLPINLSLGTYEEWDEAAIQGRGREMLERALRLWPGPQQTMFE